MSPPKKHKGLNHFNGLTLFFSRKVLDFSVCYYLFRFIAIEVAAAAL